jgi:phosphoribosylanthranilate isomerase
MIPLVKICGLMTSEALDAALDAGADMVGFVFFPPSPRNLGFDAARALGRRVAGRAQKVALTVDADDATFEALVAALAPDLLQLHGREPPERVAAIRRRFGIPVMKVIGALARYEPVAERILFDAKPPKDATRPGGNGLAFDWALIAGARIVRPWMLSGGLDAGNVAEAVRVSGAPGVDVSSGVESAPGVKDVAKIAAFVRAAKGQM